MPTTRFPVWPHLRPGPPLRLHHRALSPTVQRRARLLHPSRLLQARHRNNNLVPGFLRPLLASGLFILFSGGAKVRQSGVRFLIIPQWDLMEDEMFVDSLLESSPYPGHRPVWSKLVSTLVQAAALAIALAIPLFHIERIQILPPPPSIRMTSVQQPAALQPQSPASPRVAPAMLYEVVQPSSIPSHIARVNDRTSETG